MNAITPAFTFDLAADRFDTYVARSFAATKATRHMRDRLVAQVDGGTVDHMLLQAKPGLETLPAAANRRAALNVIDFHFEPIVMPTMSVSQATAYLQDIETTLRVTEAAGLDGEGPLWIDTVHHVCVFSVLFQLAAYLRRSRGCRQIVLLHQGQRPEPRLAIVSNLLRRVHGTLLALIPLQGRWFKTLAEVATPDTAIFYLTDMPPGAFGPARTHARNLAPVTLYSQPDTMFRVDGVSGSSILARRLGASHAVLDYPDPDGIRIRPAGTQGVSTLCPLEDWMFWPLLASEPAEGAAVQSSRS